MRLRRCLLITIFSVLFLTISHPALSQTPDGDVAPLGNRDGTVNVGDALVALRFALALETPTQEDIDHGDVAPLDATNQPNPDGVINVGDALVILRKALGIIQFPSADGTSIKGGLLTQDESWSGEILVTERVTVPEGVTLTIKPGTIVKFRHYRGYKEPWKITGLGVSGGTVIAVGTPEEQIWFTSDADEPINGDWGGISVSNSNSSVFDYTIVEYGAVGIEQFFSKVTVSNSIVRWCNSEGLYAEQSSPVFKNNTLYGNAYNSIALENYNYDAQILNNVITSDFESQQSGVQGIQVQNSTAHIEGNYFKDFQGVIVWVVANSSATVKRNKFNGSWNDSPIKTGDQSNSVIEDNDYGDGHIPIPEFDYQDIKKTELGYLPSDPEDKYLYVYDQVDETRRIVNRFCKQPGIGWWAVTYANGKIFVSSMGGDALIGIDMVTGNETEVIFSELLGVPMGLTFDGEYFWALLHGPEKIVKFKISNNSAQIIDSFDHPDIGKGRPYGIATDGEYLYLPALEGRKVYKMDKNGTKVGEINFEEGFAAAGIVWTGSYFWTCGGVMLQKWTKEGKLAGEIYPPAVETSGIDWDGNYLLAISKTCEEWNDEKVFQIEILDDSIN